MLWDTVTTLLDSKEEIAFRFRHMVTPSMQAPFAAAMAAECAAERGRFVEFTEVLFRQEVLFGQQDIISMEQVAGLSGVTELPTFQDCMESNRTASLVLEDMEASIDLALSGTPTVLTPRDRITGALSTKRLLELAVHAR
jgi:protein-disulfide isomerase